MVDDYKDLNLIQRLAKIRGMCDAVKKSKQGYGYTYSDITDILAKVTAGMSKYNVSLIPAIIGGTSSTELSVVRNTKFDKTGKSYENVTTEYLFKADMQFRWVCDDNPEDCLSVPWVVAGAQSDPSQAMGSGLTYTQRQFLTNFFQIAQNNDVDEYRSKQKAAEASEEKAIAEEIIANIDTLIRQYLAAHEEDKESVGKMVSKYVKGGNYTKITNPALAAQLLEEFKGTYLKEGK